MDTSKIIQSLCYIANSQADATVDTMKAYKLLWLADRWHLRNCSCTVSGDEYWALPKGPVPTDARNLVDGKKTKLDNPAGLFEEYIEVLPNHKIRAKKQPYLGVFSENDRKALALAVERFGNMSSYQLSDFSHEFPEWRHYEALLKDDSKKNGYRIDKDLFFINKEEESGLFVDSQEKMDFAKEMFHLYRES